MPKAIFPLFLYTDIIVALYALIQLTKRNDHVSLAPSAFSIEAERERRVERIKRLSNSYAKRHE